MFEPIPETAERLESLGAVKVVKRPSRFVPGATAYAEELHCPKCHVVHDMPADGKTISCACGLHMQARMMSLYVWPRMMVVA